MKEISISIYQRFRNITLLTSFCLFLSIVNSCCNKVEKNNTYSKICGDIKIDSLINQIIHIPEVYTPREGVDNKYRFLILNMLKSKTDSLYGFSNVLFLVIRDCLKYKAGTVVVDSVNYYNDSTRADIKLGYYILNGYRSSTIYVSYRWDENLCNWYVVKKSEGIH